MYGIQNTLMFSSLQGVAHALLCDLAHSHVCCHLSDIISDAGILQLLLLIPS